MITNYMTREVEAASDEAMMWLRRDARGGFNFDDLPAFIPARYPAELSGDKPVTPKTDGCSDPISGPHVADASPSNLFE